MVHVRLSYLTNNRVAFWTAAYKSEAGALALTYTFFLTFRCLVTPFYGLAMDNDAGKKTYRSTRRHCFSNCVGLTFVVPCSAAHSEHS